VWVGPQIKRIALRIYLIRAVMMKEYKWIDILDLKTWQGLSQANGPHIHKVTFAFILDGASFHKVKFKFCTSKDLDSNE